MLTKRPFRSVYLLLLFVSVFQSLSAQDLSWASKVGAKKFPSKTTEYKTSAYGAKGDGTTLNTVAIQKAIDACAAKGGGIVTFEPGSYLTGSIYVKSGVNLRIDKGVEIKGSEHIKDYPEIATRIAGIEMTWPSALINVLKQQNAAVTGEGIVNAQGKVFWDYYRALRAEYEPKGLRWASDYDAKRPRTLLVQESSDVTVKGITLQQAGFWTVQVLYSKEVTVDGLTIRNNINGSGPSTDGIDIDSSTWILVQNCDIDCNDDDFCLKAGRDFDGLRVNRPTEYIVIRKCTARKGAGLLTMGSETSGSIRHVLAEDLTGTGTTNCLNIKSATTRGGIVEDIHMRNVTMDGVGTVVQITMNWNPSYSYATLPPEYTAANTPAHWKVMLTHVEPAEKGIPLFRNIYLSNVNIKGARTGVSAEGMDGHPVIGVHLKDVNVEAGSAGSIAFGSGWTFENVKITSRNGAPVGVKNSTDMKVDLAK